MLCRPQVTSSLAVKENGSHPLTSSHVTHPQATPTPTPPSSLAPPPSSPSPLVTPSPPHTNSLADSETTPPQLPSNNQTNPSDSATPTDEAVDNTNEGEAPEISSEREPESHQSSVSPSLADTKVCGIYTNLACGVHDAKVKIFPGCLQKH